MFKILNNPLEYSPENFRVHQTSNIYDRAFCENTKWVFSDTHMEELVLY